MRSSLIKRRIIGVEEYIDETNFEVPGHWVVDRRLKTAQEKEISMVLDPTARKPADGEDDQPMELQQRKPWHPARSPDVLAHGVVYVDPHVKTVSKVQFVAQQVDPAAVSHAVADYGDKSELPVPHALPIPNIAVPGDDNKDDVVILDSQVRHAVPLRIRTYQSMPGRVAGGSMALPALQLDKIQDVDDDISVERKKTKSRTRRDDGDRSDAYSDETDTSQQTDVYALPPGYAWTGIRWPWAQPYMHPEFHYDESESSQSYTDRSGSDSYTESDYTDASQYSRSSYSNTDYSRSYTESDVSYSESRSGTESGSAVETREPSASRSSEAESRSDSYTDSRSDSYTDSRSYDSYDSRSHSASDTTTSDEATDFQHSPPHSASESNSESADERQVQFRLGDDRGRVPQHQGSDYDAGLDASFFTPRER